MTDEVEAAQSNIARVGFQIAFMCLKRDIWAALKTIKPLVPGHLPTWNKRSTAAISGTLDGLVRTIAIKMSVQSTARSFPLAFIMYTHNV